MNPRPRVTYIWLLTVVIQRLFFETLQKESLNSQLVFRLFLFLNSRSCHTRADGTRALMLHAILTDLAKALRPLHGVIELGVFNYHNSAPGKACSESFAACDVGR